MKECTKASKATLSNHTTRLGWIDVARACMIFFIVLGHIFREDGELKNWIYSFHVPMSIMISGMVLSSRGKNFLTFLKKRFIQLMIPYYAFSLISIAVYTVIGDFAEQALGESKGLSVLQSVLGMLWANGETGVMRWNLPLWYIPMIFSIELVGFWLFKTDKLRYMMVELVGLIGLALLVYKSGFLTNLPFSLETAIYLFPFLIIGRLLRKAYEKSRNISPIYKGTVAVLATLLGTALYKFNAPVNYVGDLYGNYISFIGIAVLLASGFIVLSSLKEDGLKPLCYVGQNTLGILLMHKFPILFFIAVLPVTRQLIVTYPIGISLVVALMSICMCLAATEIIGKIAPVLVGKKK